MAKTKKEKQIDKRYLTAFGKVRSEFIKWDSTSLVNEIIRYLYNHFSIDSHAYIASQPWLMLLLIKWIVQDVSFKKKSRPIPNSNDALLIMNMMIKLVGKSRLPTEYPSIHFWMRAMAHQQLTYQQGISLNHFGRQKLLFADLASNHTIKTDFEAQYGISIDIFLELSFALLTAFVSESKQNVNKSWFTSLEVAYGHETIRTFLNSISTDLPALKNHVQQFNKRTPEEPYELTPFVSYPLIKMGDLYCCWYPLVLYKSLDHFIYDKVKAINPSRFMDKFGGIFEDYCEQSLASSNVFYKNEEDIKAILGQDHSSVDLLIKDSQSLIFIDAKGVEMNQREHTTANPMYVEGRTKNSAIKAIRQSFSVYSRLNDLAGLLGLDPSIEPTPYVLVITYKEMYLGNGEIFYNTVAKTKIDEIRVEYPLVNIPLKNMYFVTVEQFDILCNLVKLGNTTFENMLTYAVSNDDNSSSSKFLFSMHLAHFGREPIEKLDLASDELIDRLSRALIEHELQQNTVENT